MSINTVNNYKRRLDSNHKEIVSALKKYKNISVTSTAALGHGFPDIIVGYRGYNYLFEIKYNTAPLTKDEIKFHKGWYGQLHIATCVEEILGILNYEYFEHQLFELI